MGKSSIARAVESDIPELGPKLRCIHFKSAKYIAGSQPSIIENREPWHIRFDWERRIVFVDCTRDGFSEIIWAPFEDIQCVRYERDKLEG